MIANVVNFLAVLIGGSIGLILKKFIKKDLCDAILKVIGIAVIIFGIIGVITSSITIEGNSLKSNYELVLLFSLVIGTLIGELLNIDHTLNKFGNFIERKLNKSKFSLGFINASLIFCVGAMALVGSVKAGLGDSKVIYLKSLIDGITSIVLASTLGFGVLFASFSVLIYQGIITLIVLIIGDIFDTTFINTFSMVGYALVFCIGLNFIKEEKIKIANMLPSLLIVILYNIFV
ncbi:MAG TPA: DUF554 domain-containing protein [Acholeplasmataceae bacterium]|nr:DUF554 domain-containing protein [Acholeplasmataceae bacterium]